jgi:hypothetical protein
MSARRRPVRLAVKLMPVLARSVAPAVMALAVNAVAVVAAAVSLA